MLPESSELSVLLKEHTGFRENRFGRFGLEKRSNMEPKVDQNQDLVKMSFLQPLSRDSLAFAAPDPPESDQKSSQNVTSNQAT